MADCINSTINSNNVGLSIAEEECLGELPQSPDVPVWKVLEPNSFNDFGSEVTTVARNPINNSRQRKKGVVTDLDASGGINTDLTQTNLQDILQGYMFADTRKRYESVVTATAADTDVYTVTALAASAAAVAAGGTSYAVGDHLVVRGGTGSPARLRVSAVSAGGVVTAVQVVNPGAYSLAPGVAAPTVRDGTGSGLGATITLTLAAGAGLVSGDIVLASNFNNPGNNGPRVVVGVTGGAIAVDAPLVNEVPPLAAILTKVGHQFIEGDIDVVVADGTLPRLVSTAFDMRSLGILPGEWVWLGGDEDGTAFTNTVNNGFKRVREVTQNALVFDKSVAPMASADGADVSLQIYLGKVLKNEVGPLIHQRSYQLERTLGSLDGMDPPQSEYLIGAVPDEAVLNLTTADKVTVDLSWVAIDSEQRTAAQGLKAGLRPPLVESDAYNSSSDFSRIKLSRVYAGDAAPAPLFSFATEATLTIANNLTANKAIGRLGSVAVTPGQFAVSGSLTAYFSDIAAVQAVRNNEDITLDFLMVKDNAGIAIDMPLISLGDGRVNVEQDQPIMIPLSAEASSAAYLDPDMDYTLMMVFFDYLPDAAV